MTGIEPTFKYQGAILKKDLFIDKNLGSNGIKGFENAYCMHSSQLNYYYWGMKK